MKILAICGTIMFVSILTILWGFSGLVVMSWHGIVAKDLPLDLVMIFVGMFFATWMGNIIKNEGKSK
jgi:hypothetical protein